MTKIVIGLMVCQILWQSRQSRFAAEAACAGQQLRWVENGENRKRWWLESRCQSRYRRHSRRKSLVDAHLAAPPQSKSIK